MLMWIVYVTLQSAAADYSCAIYSVRTTTCDASDYHMPLCLPDLELRALQPQRGGLKSRHDPEPKGSPTDTQDLNAVRSRTADFRSQAKPHKYLHPSSQKSPLTHEWPRTAVPLGHAPSARPVVRKKSSQTTVTCRVQAYMHCLCLTDMLVGCSQMTQEQVVVLQSQPNFSSTPEAAKLGPIYWSPCPPQSVQMHVPTSQSSWHINALQHIVLAEAGL